MVSAHSEDDDNDTHDDAHEHVGNDNDHDDVIGGLWVFVVDCGRLCICFCVAFCLINGSSFSSNWLKLANAVLYNLLSWRAQGLFFGRFMFGSLIMECFSIAFL